MAAPVPYVRRPYDNRQYAASMADLIGQRGDINTQADYNRSMNNAQMVQNIGSMASAAIEQYGQYRDASNKHDALRMISMMPEAEQAQAARAAGYMDVGDKIEDRQDRRALTQLQRESLTAQNALAQSNLEEKEYEQGLRLVLGVENLKTPEEKEAAWQRVYPEVLKLTGAKLGGMVPAFYSPDFINAVSNSALSVSEQLRLKKETNEAAAKAEKDGRELWGSTQQKFAEQLAKVTNPEGFAFVAANAAQLGLQKQFTATFGETYDPQSLATKVQTMTPTVTDISKVELPAYLASLGKTDARQLTPPEIKAFQDAQDAREIKKETTIRRSSQRPLEGDVDPYTRPPSRSDINAAQRTLDQRLSDLARTRDEKVKAADEDDIAAVRQAADAEYKAGAEDAQRRYTETITWRGSRPPMSDLTLPQGTQFGVGGPSAPTPGFRLFQRNGPPGGPGPVAPPPAGPQSSPYAPPQGPAQPPSHLLDQSSGDVYSPDDAAKLAAYLKAHPEIRVR